MKVAYRMIIFRANRFFISSLLQSVTDARKRLDDVLVFA
jgi:hypothetical protein